MAYNLGIPGDVDNSIFMINAYPWFDVYGVLQTDDFSRRMNGTTGGNQLPNTAIPQTPQTQTNPSHWLLWGIIIAIVVVIIVMNRG